METEKPSLMNLDLRAPLFYAMTQDLPPNLPEKGEFLFCFDLNPGQSRNIEPEREYLLGSLLFSGIKTDDSGNLEAQTVSLPAGKYLFIQCRKALNRDEWLDLAVEQQKDGLWERYKLKNLLYVRHLFEDGKPVTQLFRPLEGPEL